ncbi:anti-sigma factor family protein (plasmid) [Aquamicrobium terrae]
MAIFSDETIMSYVDGELDEATSGEIETALASDAELRARVDLFAQTRLAAREALEPMLDEPVPQNLKALVEAMVARSRQSVADPVPHSATAKRVLVPANDWQRLAAAACIAGLLGVTAGYYMADGSMEPSGLQIAAADPQALFAALRTAPSGEELTLLGSAERFRVIASFHDHQQALCREFELDMADKTKLTSVACDDNGQWRVRFAVNAPEDTASYAPASSGEALDAYLTAIQAGDPLSADAERQALEKLEQRGE